MRTDTMMQFPLTLDLVWRRMRDAAPATEVISRRPDRSLHRTTFGAVAARAEKLAHALIAGGIRPGDRVATLMWNHAEHLEAYLGIPLAGAVVHTLNLRLHPHDIAFIAKDAGDRWLFVDDVLLPLYEKVVAAGMTFEKVVVVGRDYEALLDGATPQALPRLDENMPLGMCYTSGTTGQPKGVVYTHRSTVLHSIVLSLPDALCLSRRDTLLPVVPMFHVNAWGLPYACGMMGARIVFPGPFLDAVSVLDLMASEKVTIGAGVPTVWIAVRDALDKEPARWALQKPVTMIVGGSAAPEQLIRDFDRHGLRLLHAWGMTETSPVGLVARVDDLPIAQDGDEAYRLRAKQGRAPVLVELTVHKDGAPVPRDGKTAGEVLIRGPWIASAYATENDPARWTEDGYFRTGDVAHVDERGFVQLTDRVADLIKSGGEWISSQALENALMGHPAVREAAVIGVPHPKWSERPLAAIVLREGATVSAEELKAFLAPQFVSYWLPDAFVFVEAIPRTTTGKFKKTELRERFAGWKWE